MNNKRSKFLTIISSFLLVVTATTLASCGPFKTKESVKEYKRSYKMNEIRIAESNTFKKLNNVGYPDNNAPTKSKISVEEANAYNNFSNETYHSIVNTSKSDNMSYATIGLYSLLNELVGASCRENLTTRLNDLLGLDKEARGAFYKKIMLANSFASEETTTQLKNAAFFNNEFKYSQDFVNYLTKLYCEAYQINFENEAEKMVEWVNKAVNSDGFIDKDFLEITKDSELYLFTALYFKNMWASKYLAKDNVEDYFYLNDGSKITTTFMNHSYMSESYYDYDSYISVKDYYSGGTASITYLVPKKTSDNIFELTKDVNIFVEDETKEVKDDSEYPSWFTINLQTPKFTLKNDLNFKDSLTSLGFGDIFNPGIDSFKNAFDDEALNPYTIYVSVMKQRNEVEFNEDGTIVKSISMAGMSKGESAPGFSSTLDVKLNQPFIYIIKDINDTPIFVGHVDNPKA